MAETRGKHRGDDRGGGKHDVIVAMHTHANACSAAEAVRLRTQESEVACPLHRATFNWCPSSYALPCEEAYLVYDRKMRLESYLSSRVPPVVLVMLDQALYSVTSFVTGIVLARTLSKSDYGMYVLAVTLVLVVLGAQRALVSVPYTVRRAHHEAAELNGYNGSVLLHEIGLLAVCALLCIALLRYAGATELDHAVVAIFAFAVVGVLFRDFVRAFLLASLSVSRVLMIGIVVNAAQLALLVALARSGALTLSTLFVVIGACSALPALLVYRGALPLRLDATRTCKDFAANFRLGRWILGSSLLFALATQSYAWLLAFVAGAEQVAAFGVASFLAAALNPLQQAVTAYLLPSMSATGSSDRTANVRRALRTATIWLGAIYGAWLLVGALFGDRLLTALYSERYAGLGTVLMLLLVSALVSALTAPVNTALDALERPDLSFRTLVAGVAVTAVCGTFATVKWGVSGAALGVLLSNSATCVLRWRAVAKLLRAAPAAH